MDSLPTEQEGFQAPAPPTNVPQPPQYFGDMYQNGIGLDPASLGTMFAPDNGDFLLDEFEDQADPKRRRIARACDMCRKKKIKCDGKMPKCSHCENYKTECVFTHIEKKRSPPKGAKYIEGLENRLGRMEHLLKLSGLLAKDDEGHTDLGTLEQRLTQQQSATDKSSPVLDSEHSAPVSPREQIASQSQHSAAVASVLTPQSDKPSPTSNEAKTKEKPKADEVEALSDLMCSLVTNSCGETRYIGSSSGFSIFSPKGITWVNEKTGDNSFEKMLGDLAADDNKWIHWKPEIFGDIFARRVFTPLPSKEDAVSLLKDFFENFNNIFPLFHEPTFMHLVDLQYSQTPYEGSGWWASLNVALAIAYRIRVMSNVAPNDADSMGWQYFKNALAVQIELTMRNNDLLSVQALLGMALYLQGTPNPQPSFFLIAAALRLAHSLGLHKRGSGFNLNKVEDEQRKRVFWIGYMLDKDICLRSGRPPIQDDDDMNVELPSADPDDKLGNIPLADGKGQSNLFLLMVTFSIIASKVYRQLYSVKASKQSDGELLNTIGELDKELEEWKDSIPLDFRPEHEINASHTPLILHVVVLHFAYYNCLTTIHRMSVHHGYWTSRLSNYAIQGLNVRPLNPRVFSSATVCVSAARASINLIKYIPHGDYAIVWLIIYYPVSALVTLFANVLQNPQDARARSDVKLMNSVVEFLPIVSTDSSGSIRQMLHICVEFVRIAKVVLDKAESEHHSRRKRKSTNATNSGKSGQTRRESGQADAAKRTSLEVPRPLNLTSQPIESPFTSPMFSDFGNDQVFNTDFSNSPYGSGMEGNGDLSGANSAANVSPRAFPNMALGGDRMVPGYGFEGADGPGSNGMMPPLGGPSFQQPFVPQDLWSIPMTFEWDWSEIANTGFPNEYGQNR